MDINIETLKRTKGIGNKTLERIIEQHNIDNNIKSFKSVYIPSDKHKIDNNINLWQGDCIKLMHHIPDKSVDMILCDLPYGTTACSWDEIIPFEPLWSHYKRIIKDNGVIVLFGSEPFSTKLRMSNLDWYKYDWIWDKVRGVGHLNAKHRPMMSTENISVFYKDIPTYNPQMRKRDKARKSKNVATQQVYGNTKEYYDGEILDYKYPINLITFSKSDMTKTTYTRHRNPYLY